MGSRVALNIFRLLCTIVDTSQAAAECKKTCSRSWYVSGWRSYRSWYTFWARSTTSPSAHVSVSRLNLLLASAHVPEGKSTPPYASARHFLLRSGECLNLLVDLENVAFLCARFLHDVHVDDESWLRLGVLLEVAGDSLLCRDDAVEGDIVCACEL